MSKRRPHGNSATGSQTSAQKESAPGSTGAHAWTSIAGRHQVRACTSIPKGTSAPGWLHMLALIDEAAADGREVFKPAVMFPHES
jgi:hypothetical protein